MWPPVWLGSNRSCRWPASVPWRCGHERAVAAPRRGADPAGHGGHDVPRRARPGPERRRPHGVVARGDAPARLGTSPRPTWVAGVRARPLRAPRSRRCRRLLEIELVALAAVTPLSCRSPPHRSSRLGHTPSSPAFIEPSWSRPGRRSEVTADPTTSLALEAAVRRRHCLRAIGDRARSSHLASVGTASSGSSGSTGHARSPTHPAGPRVRRSQRETRRSSSRRCESTCTPSSGSPSVSAVLASDRAHGLRWASR